MACCVLCRTTTTPRIEGQLAHYCHICEKGSGSRNATWWKCQSIKGAGLDWAVCRTSTCWHAWRKAQEWQGERHGQRIKRICPSQQYSKSYTISTDSDCKHNRKRRERRQLVKRQGGKAPRLRGRSWSSAAHCVTAKTAFARPGGVARRHTICSGQWLGIERLQPRKCLRNRNESGRRRLYLPLQARQLFL